MPKTILTHRGLQEIATEFGGEDVTPRQKETRLQQLKNANDLIDKWKAEGTYTENINDVIDRARKGQIDETEQMVLTNHIATLREQLRNIGKSKGITSQEFKDKFEELSQVSEAGKVMRSKAGGLLGAKSIGIPDDTLEGFLQQEKDLNKGAPLTDNQITTAVNEHSKIESAQNEFKEKYEKLQEDYAKLLAERKIKEQAATTKKNTKKTHEDFVKDRQSLIEKLKQQKADHEKMLADKGIQKQGFGFTLTTDMVKTIRDIVASHVDEAAHKLEDVIKAVHAEIKDVFTDVTERDIADVIAGNYNEKKPTRNQLAERMQNLRTQQQLIDKLDKLEKGEVPKKPEKQEKYNQEVDALRKKIKEHGLTKLTDIKERNQRELEKISEELRTGNFKETPKKTPLSQDEALRKTFPKQYKETLDSQTLLIKARQARQIRMAMKEFANLSDRERFAKNAVRYLNVPRTLMASMDFSAPLRQGIVATIAHPRLASRAFGVMFKHAFSQAEFDRFYHNLRESPRWRLYEDSKLALTDPHNLHLDKQEEAFLGGNIAEKIPIIGTHGVKGSERAYVSYLNKLRMDLFDRFADRFEADGKTFSNSPELYKSLASFVNSSTGRGNMAALESASPILSTALFAPRLIAARLNMLGFTDLPNLLAQTGRGIVKGATLGKYDPHWGLDYGFYTKMPPEIRKAAAIDMAKMVLTGITFLGAMKAAGADVEPGPRSSDFGKVKIGNTRYDIWGGFQPYVRLFAQMLTEKSKSATTGKVYDLDASKFGGRDISSQLITFGRGKLAPIWGTAADIIGRRTLDQQTLERRFGVPAWFNDDLKQGHITLTDEVLKSIIPLLASDIADAWKDRGVQSLLTAGVPSAFGVGVGTYEPKPPKQSSGNLRPQHQMHERIERPSRVTR
jgi:hypothetical protein